MKEEQSYEDAVKETAIMRLAILLRDNKVLGERSFIDFLYPSQEAIDEAKST